MKAQKFIKSLGLATVVASVATVGKANMINFTVDPNLPPTTTAYVLGASNPGVPADPVDQAQYINGILGLSLGGMAAVDGNNVYRSQNVFSGLPTVGSVTDAGNVTGMSSTITLTRGFDFLVAKYDGGNGGTEVWYVGDLPVGTVIDIPQNAFGTDNSKYGLSGTTLLDTNTPSAVPDGGNTAVLLGLAGLGLLGYARKFQAA